jgi:hypothetical protein
MEKIIPEKLKNEGLLVNNEYKSIEQHYHQKLFSLHWEIKTVLYLGVLLLSAGAGLIIYQNIDTISHQAILAALAFSCLACFIYCFKKGAPYSPNCIESPGLLYDYLLLLGCLLFLSFEGYFQFKYEIFGTRYGLAVLIPALLFFFLAYRFDHKGVLSMAITAYAAWMGLSVTPNDLLTGNAEFYEMNFVWTGIGFGISLATTSFLLEKYSIKKHFSFTYLNFAANVLLLATLAGLFMSEDLIKLLFSILLGAFCFAFIMYAKREHSFYFLLVSAIAGYIGVTYLIFLGLSNLGSGEGVVYLGIFYFIGSCGLIIYFFINHKKFLKL